MQSKKIRYLIIGLILISSVSFMIIAARRDSAIVDEIPHIGAGYAYIHYHDYRLNPEHPPIAKDLAAIPLQFIKLKYPINSDLWKNKINAQWDIGRKFIYNSGNNADKIVFLARLGIIFLTLLTSLFVYKWSKELLGPSWALLPFFLFSFSPLVLAHGHYVTTDIAATFGFLIGTYYFLKFLEKPQKKEVIKSGIALGLALLMKFSVFFILPVLLIIYLVFSFREGLNYLHQTFFKLTVIFIIALAVIYGVYFLHTFSQPLQKSYQDANFILHSFAGGPDPELLTCHRWQNNFSRQLRCIAEIDLKLFKHKVTQPIAQYLLGLIMVFQRSISGNTSYFLGKVSSSGWWYYFPVVFFLKEPIPSLILISFSIILSFYYFFKKKRIFFEKTYTSHPGLYQYSMLFLVLSYWAYSMSSSLNIGLRHILPTLPFIYILATGPIKEWTKIKKPLTHSYFKKIRLTIYSEIKRIFKLSLVGGIIIWYFIETINIAPQFIAYFNQFAGGAKNGYKYVVDSNLDWGQDLKRLAEFVKKNHIRNIKLDYFGWADPRYYLKDTYHPWSSYKGKPHGYFAVSLTFLQGAKGKLVPGERRRPEDEYRWLKDPYHPYKKIGYSIFLYKFK